MNQMAQGSGRLLRREDCRLILIDLQERLTPVMFEPAALLANAARLARFAGIVGLPVLVTEQEKLGPTIPEVRGVLPAGAVTVGKVTFDSLAEPAFGRALAAGGGQTLVLAGVEAHICVAQTALAALAQGYAVHVAADAVASRVDANRQVALARLAAAGAVITSTEMFIYEILQRAGTPEFKEVLPLVK
ncbi:MAG: isochorismatase family protein [Deltaproteobacteria bacterium]|nr:isochorismatase family protein [Deltaproteobacteria bacterium]